MPFRDRASQCNMKPDPDRKLFNATSRVGTNSMPDMERVPVLPEVCAPTLDNDEDETVAEADWPYHSSDEDVGNPMAGEPLLRSSSSGARAHRPTLEDCYRTQC